MTTRIMLLDPIPTHLATLTDLFLKNGCHVAAYASGEEGMNAYARFQPHMLVSELFLKDWHRAWQIGQWIYQDDPKVRPYLLALTCQVKDERETRKQMALCLENGFDEVLRKPMKPSALMLRVGEARRRALVNGSYV